MANREVLGKAANVAKIVSAVVGIALLFLGGGWFYEVWHASDLVHSVLPTYEVGDQAFSGVVVENRGRATAHNVRISIANLGSTIDSIEVETSEPFQIEDGGRDKDRVTVFTDRLVSGASVTIYMLTGIPTSTGKEVTVTSDEGPGSSIGEPRRGREPESIFLVSALTFNLFLLGVPAFLRVERRMGDLHARVDSLAHRVQTYLQ